MEGLANAISFSLAARLILTQTIPTVPKYGLILLQEAKTKLRTDTGETYLSRAKRGAGTNAPFPPMSQRMRESISILFPVRDRQAQIKSRVEGLLELLCELSQDVQIIVVDDQSTDATPEVLDDMRRMYPQVNVIRNATSVGPAQSVESALCHARGDFIFLHQSYEPIDFEEIVQLWQLRRDEQLVIARAATRVRRIDQQLLQRLQEWGRKLEEHWPTPRAVVNGLQMMRKDAVKTLSKVKDTSEELEVTHQSHRRITAPKFIQAAPAAQQPLAERR